MLNQEGHLHHSVQKTHDLGITHSNINLANEIVDNETKPPASTSNFCSNQDR